MSFTVQAENTPNPQALKFHVNQPIATGAHQFKKGELIGNSPLARKLFGFPWVDQVFIGQDFVSVTKQDWVDWEDLSDALSSLILEHLETGAGVIVEPPPVAASSNSSEQKSSAPSSHAISENDSSDVRLIKELLDSEIRPAVAMDGGDVQFHSFENNVLKLHMHGSCDGCPSSTYTLKEGIATRLRERLPNLVDVEAV